MKKALVTQGGWEGHEPVQVSLIFEELLKNEGFAVDMFDTLDCFLDAEKLGTYDIIAPIWTMSKITNDQRSAVCDAVASGVGLAGNHGGMCDAFREDTEWQFMTGSQWVAHPGNDGTPYRVNIKKNSSSPIIEGIDDFDVASEQYYLHTDPVVNVLASTRFPVADGPHASNGEVDVPVVYTKLWGKGRVFYNSLGHVANVFDIPEAKELMRRGLIWAARR